MSTFDLIPKDSISEWPSKKVYDVISYLPKAIACYATDLYKKRLNQQELMRIYDIMEICARNRTLNSEQMQFFAALIQFNKMM